MIMSAIATTHYLRVMKAPPPTCHRVPPYVFQAYGTIISTVGGAKGFDALKRARYVFEDIRSLDIDIDQHIVSAMIAGKQHRQLTSTSASVVAATIACQLAL
jgi:hypothetical protein